MARCHYGKMSLFLVNVTVLFGSFSSAINDFLQHRPLCRHTHLLYLRGGGAHRKVPGATMHVQSHVNRFLHRHVFVLLFHG